MESIFLNDIQYGYWFYAIPVGLVIWFFYYFFSKHRLVKVFSQANLIKNFRRNKYLIYFKNLLWVCGIALVLVSFLDPRWGFQEIKEVEKSIDISILIDVSASMLVEDQKPNRLSRVKLKINQLIDLVKKSGEYRIALTVFSGAAFVYSPLTKDYSALKKFVVNIEQGMVSEQGTDLALGLKTALSVFNQQKEGKQKVVIIFTDGESHDKDVIEMAKNAYNQSVIIHSIGVGTPNGQMIPIRDKNGRRVGTLTDKQGRVVISKLDQKTLFEISNITGGHYFDINLDDNDFKYIIEEVKKLSQINKRTKIVKSKKARYQLFLVLALLLFSTSMILPEQINFNSKNY